MYLRGLLKTRSDRELRLSLLVLQVNEQACSSGVPQEHWNNVSQTQELLTKIHTICVETHNIKRTSQKQYIKTPFKGQGKDSPQMTDRCYNSPPHKEEEQDSKPDYSHMASTSPSPSSPPTDSSNI